MPPSGAGSHSGAGARRGTQRPTLKDVAHEARVSPGLVSMVLSGRPGPSASTAARVLEVADRMGYRPDRAASMLARHRTGLVGVTLTPSNPYHGAIVEEVIVRAHDRGYEVLVSAMSPRHDYRASLESLVNSRCEALVLLNPQLPDRDLATLVDGIPTVCFGRTLNIPRIDVVRTDDQAAMGMLVDHLVELGHRDIVHVDGGDQQLTSERSDGYAKAMRRHRLRPLVLPGGETLEDGQRAAAEVMALARCTAVVMFNDVSAIGIIDTLERSGVKVPADISVTGFDDSWVARVSPIDLTTIDPSPLEQARISVDLVLEQVKEGRSRRVTRIVEPHLVARGSTAPPRSR